MKYALITGLLMSFLSNHALSSSTFNKTDLRGNGNTYVLEQNRRFLESKTYCQAESEDSFRVIIQGFSLFSKLSMNISGAVVDTLAGLPLNSRSLLGSDQNGSRVKQMTIMIAGKKVELCLVVSEVLWDLAAANLIAVANDFKPDFILLSGRGSNKAVIETGGRNESGSLSGYFSDGTNSGPVNRPRSKRIDPRYKSSKVIKATWNYESILKSTKPMIESLGHQVKLGSEGRVENNYICNNIHYALLQSATEGNIELAGGLLKPSLEQEEIPAIGFFHYPSNTLQGDKEVELDKWSLVIKEIIKAQLNL
jgi:hypothetical protein